KREVEKIRGLNRYAAVLNVYMEERPLVSEWATLTSTSNVVVVPFFIADGLHSYEDIPRLLGISESSAAIQPRSVFRRNPYRLNRRSLFYAPSIGTDPGVADIIISQAKSQKDRI